MHFKKLSKKAQVTWVEITFIALLITGGIISAIIPNSIITYTVAFLCGLIFGKLIYHKKEDFVFPYILLTIGFIIGYLIGMNTGSRMIVIISFLAGNFISYRIHEQGLF